MEAASISDAPSVSATLSSIAFSSSSPTYHSSPHQLHSVSVGVYDRSLHVVRVPVVKGKLIAHMGAHRGGILCLFVEEALHLLELGVLEVLYDDVPLTVQEGYALLASLQWTASAPTAASAQPSSAPLLSTAPFPLAPQLHSPLESFLAYCHLRQLGCVVLRPSALHRPRRAAAEPSADAARTASSSLQGPSTGDDPHSSAANGSGAAMSLPPRSPHCQPFSNQAAEEGEEREEVAEIASDVFLVWGAAAAAPFKRTAPLPPDLVLLVHSSSSSSPEALDLRAASTAAFCAAVASALTAFFASSTLSGLQFAHVPLLVASVHSSRVSLLSIAPMPTQPLSDEAASSPAVR